MDHPSQAPAIGSALRAALAAPHAPASKWPDTATVESAGVGALDGDAPLARYSAPTETIGLSRRAEMGP